MPNVMTLFAVAASLALLVATAAFRVDSVQWAYLHMMIAAVTAILLAAVAVRRCRVLLDNGASASAVASSNAWYMGLIWTWGVLALLFTYGTGILRWSEWWHFLIGFAVAAGLSLYFASVLGKDAEAGREDETRLRNARILAKVQLVGMVITMLGLLIDGKMVRFFTLRFTDWAANNVFFFGAMAIAIISAYALRNNKHA
ncbi:hypothetical protein ACO2I3_07295 [Leptospira interrogans]